VFKRIFWMSTGIAVGASGAFWAKRKVEETVEQYLPEQVTVRAAATAKGLGTTVRQAAVEGREAMRTTEAELRARVEARTFVGDPPPHPKDPKPATAPRRAGRVATHAGTGSAGRRRARR
jgi:hypothetical protein